MSKINQSPILITGAARSGTSMVAGIINICGAFGGKMSSGNKYNPRGMFENSKIRNSIVKPHLRQIGADPKGQYPLPDPFSLQIPGDWGHQVEKVMFEQGYDGKFKVFYKGAKACLMWPIWYNAFPNAKWIIVRRRTGDIVRSCIKTGFMNAFKDRKGWLWWVHQHEKRFIEMMQNELDIRIVWPEKMLYDDYNEIQETVEDLGLQWKPKEVRDFIEPRLWHAKRNKHT